MLSIRTKNFTNYFFKHLLLLNSAEGKKTSRNTSSKPNIEKMQNSKKYNPVTHVIFDLDGLLLGTIIKIRRLLRFVTIVSLSLSFFLFTFYE